MVQDAKTLTGGVIVPCEALNQEGSLQSDGPVTFLKTDKYASAGE